MSSISKNLTLIRYLSGMTQPKFAKLIMGQKGTKGKISSYETDAATPSLFVINSLAKFAGVSSDDLINRELREDEIQINKEVILNVKKDLPEIVSENEETIAGIIAGFRVLKDRLIKLEAKVTKRDYKSLLLEVDKDVPNFSDITPALLMEYEKYCKSLGNSGNTIWGSVKFVKQMINAALNDNIIQTNPLRGYKAPQYVGPERDYLTDKELEQIEKFSRQSTSEKLVKVSEWFLFSCYTGLRYGDVKNFDKSKIVGDRIILRTGKKKKDVTIKLHPKLSEILLRIKPGVYSNQKMNDYLKIIAERCDINKALSYHLARHSFAVYFLNHGGRMETLSKILGHSNLRTTQIYGKITDITQDEEMDKVWRE